MEKRDRTIQLASPGIGKSRLLDQIEMLGEERDFRNHRARCWEEGGAPALWPWMQLEEATSRERHGPSRESAGGALARFAHQVS